MLSSEQWEHEYRDILDALRGLVFSYPRWRQETDDFVTETVNVEPLIDPQFGAVIRFDILGWEFNITHLYKDVHLSFPLPEKRSQLTSMCVRRNLRAAESEDDDPYTVSYGCVDTIPELIAWLESEFARTPYDQEEED